MQKNDSQDQLESRWKRKYFDNLDKTETLEKKLLSRIKTLADGLTDVCNYGSELVPRVTKEWTALKRVTKKHGKEINLTQPIKNLTAALHSQAIANHSARRHTGRALLDAIEQLLALNPPAPQNRNLRKLKQKLIKANPDEIELAEQITNYSRQMRDTLSLLNANKHARKKVSLFRIFKKGKKQKEDAEPAGKSTVSSTATNSDAVSNTATEFKQTCHATDAAGVSDTEKITEILLYLLDQLDIPKPLSESAHQLNTRLKKQIGWANLDDILMPLFDLTLASIDWHYSQFGEFLEQINSQLDAVQNYLHVSHEVRQQQSNNKEQLNTSVVEVVTEIEQAIDNNDNIDTLKQTISHKMRSIVGALHEFEESEKAREAELMGELQTLGGKLHQLEAQSQAMREKLESQKQLARRDNVTQLPNRAAYDERMQYEFSRWQRYNNPLSIIVGDIDHFKKFNDEFGHLAGDAVLKIVAQTLRKNLRETDFVARYGGEEFVMLLPSTERNQAEKVSEKLRQCIEELPFSRHGKTIGITISFGVSQLVEKDNKESLFERADQALYYAKKQGRNRCCSA